LNRAENIRAAFGILQHGRFSAEPKRGRTQDDSVQAPVAGLADLALSPTPIIERISYDPSRFPAESGMAFAIRTVIRTGRRRRGL
jgi:hypothetical protein